MRKNYDIDKYKNTILDNKDFFKKYYYHSIIDSNLIKLDYILKLGILSKRLIEYKNASSLYTHQASSYDSKNGYDYISLSEYNDDTSFVKLFESFTLHTLTSLSLIIDKDIIIEPKGKIETFFDDELFYKNEIPKDKIKGIILPEHLTKEYIKNISCLPNDLECYTYKYINHWISEVERYFNDEIPKEIIIQYLKYFKEIINDYESPERWVSSILETEQRKYGQDLKDVLANILHNLWSKKLNISCPTFIDVINYLNKDNLPIYEINQKTLKKMN